MMKLDQAQQSMGLNSVFSLMPDEDIRQLETLLGKLRKNAVTIYIAQKNSHLL